MKTKNLQEMLESKKEVIDYFKDGKCSGCGNCCGRILALSQKEINQIKGYIKRYSIKQNLHSINVLNTKVLDYTCPFLNDEKTDKKCEIYPVRPLICREFTCNSYLSGNKPSTELMKEPRHVIDMTETFFGKGEET